MPGALRSIVSMLIAVPVFIAESVRLFGAHLFLMPRGGILAGTLERPVRRRDRLGSCSRPLATLVGHDLHPPALRALPDGAGLVAGAARPGRGGAATSAHAAGRSLRNVELPLALPGHPDRRSAGLRPGARRHRRGGNPGRPVGRRRRCSRSSSASTTRRTGRWARHWHRPVPHYGSARLSPHAAARPRPPVRGAEDRMECRAIAQRGGVVWTGRSSPCSTCRSSASCSPRSPTPATCAFPIDSGRSTPYRDALGSASPMTCSGPRFKMAAGVAILAVGSGHPGRARLRALSTGGAARSSSSSCCCRSSFPNRSSGLAAAGRP